MEGWKSLPLSEAKGWRKIIQSSILPSIIIGSNLVLCQINDDRRSGASLYRQLSTEEMSPQRDNATVFGIKSKQI